MTDIVEHGTDLDLDPHQVLRGRVAIVTGATANLGRQIAEQLSGLGADLVLNYHRATRAEQTERVAKALPGRAVAVAADVTRSDDVSALFDRAVKEFGRVDIVVNNAGLVVKKPLAETTDEDFDQCFAVNTRSAFLTMREAARRLEPGGRVVNIITSIVAFTIPFYGVYAGSKGAVEHLTKALAKEVGPRGITVNCVAPGPLNTSFYYPAESEESIAGAKSRSIANRLGEVTEVAPLVAFLCRPEASWITAQTIRVNGGMA